MGARSAVSQLPTEVRASLDQRLLRGGFAGYEDLADWLSGEGYQISKSAVHRYGQQLQQRIEAIQASTAAANALEEVSPDNPNALSGALVRLLETRIFEMLVNEDDEEAPLDPISMSKLARAVGDLARASTSVKKYSAEVRQRAVEAAGRVHEVARQGGLSAQAAEIIRREILGVAG